MNNYTRFFLMVGTSTVIMLGLMYLNTYEFGHVYFSETRLYMSFIMGATMLMVMMGFMWSMYRNTKINAVIVLMGAVILVGALSLVRSQATVADESWMKAMIPHHSIAILTSERAHMQDVRVRKLADNIIRAQEREIKEMQWMIKDIEENGVAKTEAEANARPVPSFSGSES